VAVEPSGTLPRRLGLCLAGLEGRGTPDRSWSAERLPAILDRWYRTGHQ
jgi:hypothetical protein